MKCPKCGYLGFETTDRCRNCGYDFSLAIGVSTTPELPLNSPTSDGGPLADFELSRRDLDDQPTAALDLDRVIGATTLEDSFVSEHSTPQDRGQSSEAPAASQAAERMRSRRAAPNTPAARVAPDASSAPVAPGARSAPGVAPNAPGAPYAPSAPGAPGPARGRARAQTPSVDAGLPLFGDGRDDDAPLITTPRPARPPLSVRRTTPEIPRVRARTVTPRPQDNELRLQPASAARGDEHHAARESGTSRRQPGDAATTEMSVASGARRLGAAAIDILILGAINAVVVYLTLALTGLGADQLSTLPLLPLATFLALLDGAYLVAFAAAAGQTIGKMMTSIRVVKDDGGRLEMSGAVVRAIGCGASLLTVGLGYLPAFVTADGRALQDRISGTRVVSAR